MKLWKHIFNNDRRRKHMLTRAGEEKMKFKLLKNKKLTPFWVFSTWRLSVERSKPYRLRHLEDVGAYRAWYLDQKLTSRLCLWQS